ncbi:MAG: zinc metallopeptidase [Anaerolineales bacterium]|nr:zinc metallopeptidase [Anaerolineales bacterium]MCS7247997.1 zinc metallopeptidase [Anaerolineales bacterium]MDW8161809.1 zinc metallopeptidase [Anaerolineales bacterium]MDW8446496.1 zinc metallopeptidase [Anaerolineales bacterium]
MFFFDPYYLIFMAPAFLLMLAVQFYVSSSYSKWSQVPSRLRINGAQAAAQLIRYTGLYNVRVEGVHGHLTDHYDPRDKTLRLSESVYGSASVAALAVAAHELGHALQDHEGYAPLKLRAALVPAVNIGSYLGWILLMIGLLLQSSQIAWLGVIVFSGGAIFALATLPVEFNASARARRLLLESGLISTEEELRGVNQVLNAAALTYVAALVTAVLQLLYYATLVLGMSDRRRE